jgi:hypothetical protein
MDVTVNRDALYVILLSLLVPLGEWLYCPPSRLKIGDDYIHKWNKIYAVYGIVLMLLFAFLGIDTLYGVIVDLFSGRVVPDGDKMKRWLGTTLLGVVVYICAYLSHVAVVAVYFPRH